MNTKSSLWLLPSVVLSIGLIAILLRVGIKLGVGIPLNSPLLTGDGFHNIGDAGYVLGALLIMWIMKWKRDVMHAGENMGVMFQFAVAWVLLGLAGFIAYYSLLGLLPCPACEETVRGIIPFIPEFTPRSPENSSLGLIVIALVASIALSLSASSYHIHAGKKANYATLVTVGKETRSDALIECSILAGFAGEYFFAMPAIEYLFGVIVAGLITHTAWELWKEANDTFLQISLGKEFVSGIEELARSTCGVRKIVKLETYPVLRAARIKIWLETEGGAEANEDIQYALEERIRVFAKEKDFSECRPDVYFQLPEDRWHRVAYTLTRRDGEEIVAQGLSDATVICVCDVPHDEEIRGTDDPAPKDTALLLEFCARKEVSMYRSFQENAEIVEALQKAGIRYRQTPTLLPPP